MSTGYTLEDLNNSIKKWEKIENGELDYEYGRKWKECPLCVKTAEHNNGEFDLCLIDDQECPLRAVGQGCLDYDSAWDKWYHSCGNTGSVIDALKKARAVFIEKYGSGDGSGSG
jgi:hypothetical protein